MTTIPNNSKILVIGGTDPSGAGLQTDWKIIHALKCSAKSIVTAVTAQNHLGVQNMGVLSTEQISAQFESIKQDTFSAIKIGMLGNAEIIEVLINYLHSFSENYKPIVILDPVLIASSGGKLLEPAAYSILLNSLLPFVDLLTPNIQELTLLTQTSIETEEQASLAVKSLNKFGVKSVLVKGGHWQDKQHSNDLFFSENTDGSLDGKIHGKLVGKRWKNRQNVRGTGCALATAIAVFSAQGYCLTDAIVIAKSLVSRGIRKAKKLGESLQLNIAVKEPRFKSRDLPRLFIKAGKENNNKDENNQNRLPSCGTKKLGIYPVVDSFEWIQKLVPLGIKTIQLRIKDKAETEVEAEIKATIDYCKEHQIRLFINDYWRLAIKHQAYGIHLGQEDIETADLDAIAQSGCRLGLSTHSYTEVARAHAIKPSYLALGPIFATSSKIMPWIPQGVDAVSHWVKLLGDEYPLVAIGGIDHQRAEALKKTGVGSVAMISSITQAKDYKKATLDLIKLWE